MYIIRKNAKGNWIVCYPRPKSEQFNITAICERLSHAACICNYLNGGDADVPKRTDEIKWIGD